MRKLGGRTAYAPGEQGFYKSDDGHLVLGFASLAFDNRYQSSGLAKIAVDNAVLMLGKLTKDPKAEIRLRAAGDVGAYAWAKEFSFAGENGAKEMRAQLGTWLDKQLAPSGALSKAQVEAYKAKAKAFTTPAEFADLGRGEVQMTTTHPSRKGLRLDNVHPGKAFMLTGAQAWDGVMRPFATN